MADTTQITAACNLLNNQYHQKGDNKPSLQTHKDAFIEIKEPGRYKVALWSPKEGKITWWLKLTKIEDQFETAQDQQAATPEPEQKKPEPPKQAQPSALFKR